MSGGDHGRRRRGPGPRRGHGHGHGGGSPWDPRSGFGPGFRPPFRGRKAARGDVRASVLALLAEQPMHGYQIINELAERSQGAWRPSPGSVYPILQQLQDEGLVRVEETDGRRVVHLTDAGRAYVDTHHDELAAPWEAVGGQQDEQTWELMSAVRAVTGAAWQVAQAGTTADLERATALLTEVRRRLYGILAGSTEDGPDDSPEDRAQPAGDADS
jgi:DNA-binding PadR family transcriptional regulator